MRAHASTFALSSATAHSTSKHFQLLSVARHIRSAIRILFALYTLVVSYLLVCFCCCHQQSRQWIYNKSYQIKNYIKKNYVIKGDETVQVGLVEMESRQKKRRIIIVISADEGIDQLL